VNTWNPDPRWPQHIVALAAAIADGVDARPMLHDALLEEGLPEIARYVSICSLGCIADSCFTRSIPIGIILNDGCAVGKWWMSRIDPYLASCSLNTNIQPSQERP
jgi:hypothetical protein